MANIRKTFNFRNGVQVDEDNFIVDSLGKVGIGTTVPDQFIDCRGNAKIVGILTSQSLETRNVNIAGVTTFSGNTHVGSAITMYPASGIISATQIHGDGRNLINIPTSQWTDINAGLGHTSIYNEGFVGVSTNDPRFTLQIGGNNDLTTFANGVGINSSGNIVATGVITATTFKGDYLGSLVDATIVDAEGLVVSGISTISGVSINSGHASALSVGSTNLNVTGVSTFAGGVNFDNASDAGKDVEWQPTNDRLSFMDDVKATFGDSQDLSIYHTTASGGYSAIVDGGTGQLVIGGNIIELKNAALNQTYATLTGGQGVELNYAGVGKVATGIEGVIVTGIASAAQFTGRLNAGIATVTTKLDLGDVSSQGISTSTPQSELHVFNSGISSVLIESGSNASIVTLGRTTNGQTSGAIRYGNKSAGFPYSNEDALDIINYGVGNVNYYLSAGTTGGTGDFVWHYRSNNTRLMTLTNDGKLGVGVTVPNSNLHVVGTSTCTGNSFFGSDVEIAGSITIKGVGNIILPSGITVGGSGLLGDILSGNNEVVFDNGLTPAGAQNRANTYVTTGISTFSQMIVDATVGISTNSIATNLNGEGTGTVLGVGREENRRFVVADTGYIGINTSIPRCDVDFAGIGKTDVNFMRLPTHSTAGRDQLDSQSLLDGALIYNTSLKKIQFHDGTAWRTVTSS